ncbi:myosin head [Oesophagostomum dentatum]|uniref:Myosin head n=1 Tax=Oesophagostomum dentatum TaxID=61180 RepID=A0A0B1TDL2_OESDE|nr:myosin head [Oesophagostomum dentatum]
MYSTFVQVIELPVSSPNQLPFLRNPTILVGKDDLTALSYLHEPAVLHNLQVRFIERQCIYTYCGIVLVAINPYADCHQLYGEEVIQVYRGVGKQVRELDPHIYAVAEEAFYDLAEFNKCQSIIVSGESGAGKTVSAKFVMKYFASIAGHRTGSAGVEDRVLATNPIMEAIGNAKTIRNDNSSRFGKFIQINFGEKFTISGAEMKTYLLEKSRLVFQAPNERNYHIFYQLCAARDHPLIRDFKLGSSDAYWYTAQGGDSKIPGVDDREDFLETVKALDILGFSQEKQRDVFRIIKGILLLGNIEFKANGDDSVISSMSNSEILQLCEDYKINEAELRLWLTVREIRAAGEVVRKGLEPRDAVRSRDALAKLLYAQVFSWFVDRFNDALTEKEKRVNRNKKFIGVLDIYGFETFEVNSFEQFCINYANEKLQQQFNQHVFKLEQEEYEREELSWVRIDFHDNQPTIDLIEGRPGLIDYLDEQCKEVLISTDTVP